MSITVTKCCEDAPHQFTSLMRLPEEIRPPKLAMPTESCLTYELVHGSHPTRIAPVWDAANRSIWAWADKPEEIDREKYLRYVYGVSKTEGVSMPSRLAESIRQDLVTLVGHVHGDLTLHNVIERSGSQQLIFIDPGHAHGMACRELDEAKLLQTLDGFCLLYRGCRVDPGERLPVAVRRIHWALLWTHYVRLLRHMRSRKRKDCEIFARRRLSEIGELFA